MNSDIIKGKWKQLSGRMKERWGNLTDDDLDVAEGHSEYLAGKLQERYGWRAGYVQMGLDCLILLSAFFIVDVERALWSILAALTLNQVLSMNHRPGRYGG